MSSRAVLAKRTAQSTTVKQPQSGANFGTQAGANRSRPPGSSMAGQVAFSQAQQFQQPPLSLQQQQQMGAPPRKVGMRPPSQTPGPQLTQQQQYSAHFGGMPQQPQKHKISFEAAIALTTIRLSAAEQNIIDIQSQIGDILMNGMMGGAFEEYDEDGNVVSMPPMMAGASAGTSAGASAAGTGISLPQFDALKKEVDDLKARFTSIEKMGKEVQSATGAVNNAMAMIKKLSTDNMQFKNQITQLTNLLNKTVGDMDRRFNDMTQTIATLEYQQQQVVMGGNNEQYDDGVHLEINQIHDNLQDDTPLFTGENPMHNLAAPEVEVVNTNNDTPLFAPNNVTNEPMKPSSNGPRRGGAAAAMIAASATNGGNKRPPAINNTSIDL